MKHEKNQVVELEEMDWQTTKTNATEGIRQNLLQLELNYDILEKANLRLREIHDLLPKEEKERRARLKQ